jgi:ABC-type proline/glycine betaine transport system permease subunit
MQEKDYFWLLGLYLLTELLSVADYFWFRGTNAHSRYFILFISQNYVIYTLFGFYIDRVMKKERMNLENATLLIIASALAIGGSYMLTEWKMASVETWTGAASQTFFNTFISIPSIAVFFIAKCLYTRRPIVGHPAAIWSLLATGTFGTYLFERYWRDTTQFAYELANRKLSPFVSSFFHILVATALGILATLAYKLLTGMILSLFRKKKDSRREKLREKRKIVYTVPAEDISDLEEIETLLVGNAQHNASAGTRKDQTE